MDLAFTPEEQAFALEVRAWLAENVEIPPRFENIADEVEFGRRWQSRLADSRWVGIHWPPEYGGRGASPVEVAIFNMEYARSRAAADQPGRHQPRGTDAARARHRRPEGALAARDPHGRRDLVPAVLGTRCRLRPRFTEDPGAARRRRLAALGPEGVDVVRAVRPLGHLPRAHRRRRPEAQGHLVSRRRHVGAGDRGAAARPDHRRRRVQRGVPRRGVRARRPARRRLAQRLGGGEHDARARTRHGLPVQGTGRARGVPRRAVATGLAARDPRRCRDRRRARAVVRRAARPAVAQLADALAPVEGHRTRSGVERHQTRVDRHDASAVGARSK